MPLSVQKLLALAGTGAYRQGAEYCRQKRVTLGERKGRETYAAVRGSRDSDYTVFYCQSHSGGDIDSCGCDCPGFARDGFCKHIVAAVLEAQSAVSGQERVLSAASTSTEARKLLYRSAKRVADRAAASRRGGNVALEATLELASFGLGLSLRVGTERMYMVRDLYRFREQFRSGDTVEYGRHLALWHHPSSFAAESRPLLELFLRSIGDDRDNQSRWKPGVRILELGPALLMELLALYEGQELPVRVSGVIEPRVVRREDYRVPLRLRDEDGGCRLSAGEHFRFFRGDGSAAVMTRGRIYLCSSEWAASCGDLLETLTKNGGFLIFSRRDLTVLHTTVLTETQGFLSFDIDGELASWKPEPLITKIYFEAPSPEYVTARMTFSYGERTYPAFREKNLRESFDLAGELLAQDILTRYFRGEPDQDGTLSIDGDMNALYHLVSKGLEELSGLGELYLAEEFRRLRLRPPSSARAGVRVSGNRLLLDFELDGVDSEDLSGVLESYRRKKRYHRLRDGSFLSLEEGPLMGLAEMAGSLGLDEDAFASGHAELEMNRSLYLDTLLTEGGFLRYDRDNGFRELVRSMNGAEADHYPVPESLQDVLRDYQKTGYHWLRTLWRHGFGGILADDMGLGKTVQILALLQAYKETGEGKPSLVICPASLTLNWESEAVRFTPGLRARALTGAAPEREEAISIAGSYDLLITSYDQLKRDIRLYENIEFAFIVADEAQFIKNPGTQNAKSVKLLNGSIRLALTGTPVENSLAELWSIFDFLMPGYLFTYAKFRQLYEAPIVKSGDTWAADRLKRLARPFLLRRLKGDVLRELPPKTETVLRSAMEPEQRRIYLAALAEAKRELNVKLSEPGEGQGRFIILAALTRMRQICCDPSLLFEGYDGGSVKLDACMDLVESCVEAGRRVLLFSQFTSMLEILENRLEAMGIAFYKLTGATKTASRQELVNSFNDGDIPVFLISLKAGGTGLNLTGADVVIHYDPWWNAGSQNQATDRAHRIGQRNSVQVYKLIVKDSVEERILQMQEAKTALAESILQEGGDALTSLTRDELLSLLEE